MTDSQEFGGTKDAGKQQPEANRFLWAWLLALLVLGGLVFPGVTLLTLDFSRSSEALWVDQLYARKLRAIELRRPRAGGPMLLTFGGSAGLFGVDTQMLAEHIGMPAVNCNTHGALGLDYHLARIRREARRGDTALLVIETSMPFKDPAAIENLLKEAVWTYDREYLAHASPWRLLNLLYLNRTKDYATSLENRWRRARGEQVIPRGAAGGYGYLRLSPTGDFAGSVPERAFVSNTNPSATVHPGAKAALQKLVAWCEKNGVHLRLAAAAVCQPQPADALRRRQQYAAADALFAELGIPVWSRAAESEYPRELFLDTPMHLTPAGRRIYTERLLENWRRLSGAPPAGPPAVYLTRNRGQQAPLPSTSDASPPVTKSYWVAAEPVAHPDCVSAGELGDFLRQRLDRGETVHFSDPAFVPMIAAAGFSSVEIARAESTLADWHRRQPQAIFLLARVGPAGIAFASDDLPAEWLAALRQDDFRAAIARPGQFQSAAGNTPLAARWEATATSPFSFEILLRSGSPEDFRRGERPITINGEPIGTAEPGLAVAVLDPSAGIVVATGTFAGDRIVETRLFRVAAP